LDALRLVGSGFIEQGNASRMGISESAVKNTLQQLFGKTEVRTRSLVRGSPSYRNRSAPSAGSTGRGHPRVAGARRLERVKGSLSLLRQPARLTRCFWGKDLTGHTLGSLTHIAQDVKPILLRLKMYVGVEKLWKFRPLPTDHQVNVGGLHPAKLLKLK
jgi:hypothetical protein